MEIIKKLTEHISEEIQDAQEVRALQQMHREG